MKPNYTWNLIFYLTCFIFCANRPYIKWLNLIFFLLLHTHTIIIKTIWFHLCLTCGLCFSLSSFSCYFQQPKKKKIDATFSVPQFVYHVYFIRSNLPDFYRFAHFSNLMWIDYKLTIIWKFIKQIKWNKNLNERKKEEKFALQICNYTLFIITIIIYLLKGKNK